MNLTYQDYRHVSTALDSIAGIRSLLGKRDQIVCRSDRKQFRFSRQVIDVTEYIHAQGIRPVTMSKRAIIVVAMRCMGIKTCNIRGYMGVADVVVSFKMSQEDCKQLDRFRREHRVLGASSINKTARKIVSDFLAGRLAYCDLEDSQVDCDMGIKTCNIRVYVGVADVVVSFRMSQEDCRQLDRFRREHRVLGASSINKTARKIVSDFLAGRLAYRDLADSQVDCDSVARASWGGESAAAEVWCVLGPNANSLPSQAGQQT